MDDNNYKEVYYHQYCKDCKHKDNPDYTEPCEECLETPINVDSHKPINWTEDK